MQTRLLFSAVVLVAAMACSGDDDAAPSPNPTNATITITASGVSPQSVTLTSGGRVTWINNDTARHQPSSDPHPLHNTARHQPSSDPHPLHTDCPGLTVSELAPGQQAQSGTLNVRRTCGFHDHLNDGVASLRGTVIVQ
jgi:plastocyanin